MEPLLTERRLAVFVVDSARGAPVSGVSVHAAIELQVSAREPNGGESVTSQLPLGSLITDHAGFASFDLDRLNDLAQAVVAAAGTALPRGNDLPAVAVTKALVGFQRPDGTVDTVDAIADGVGFRSSEAIVLRYAAQVSARARGELAGPAMQNPSLVDWRLSPTSFAISPRAVLGDGGCEQLLPSNIATHEYRFRQIVRERDGEDFTTGHQETIHGGHQSRLHVRRGVMHYYRTAWHPIGHGLGQIAYSLPLAPCESVNIAVIDWSRRDVASRNEDLTVQEQLLHNLNRDRSIDETVDAAMHEWQRGGSFMAGAAGSYGGMISGSLGGGYATSSGDRDLRAETSQQLSESIVQASTSTRKMMSTIVVQSSQQEHEAVQTRVVVNHNHCHALTVLYYEIVRHFRVVTEWVASSPVLFVPYDTVDFDEDHTLRYRLILEQALLDQRLRSCFEVLQKVACDRLTFDPARFMEPAADHELATFEVIIKSGAQSATGWKALWLETVGGARLDCVSVNPDPSLVGPPQYRSLPNHVPDPSDPSGSTSTTLFLPNTTELLTLRPERRTTWGEIRSIVMLNDDGRAPWEIERLVLKTRSGDDSWELYNGAVPAVLPPRGQTSLPVNPIGGPKTADSTLTRDERCCIEQLLNHLNANKLYYNRAIWLAEDPEERAVRFDELTSASSSTTLLDAIENRPVAVFGAALAFPAGDRTAPNAVRPPLEERLVSVPARGVFAEAKLGQCNACEVIDNTRFWDWQQSPCPEKPTEIAPIDTGSRARDEKGLTPSNLPNGVVNIVNPPAAPDPAGMAGALTLLGRSEIFRDMSMQEEVAQLLTALANGTMSMSAAQGKAKSLTSGGKTGGSAVGQAGGAKTSPGTSASSPTPSQQLDQLQVLRNAEANREITPDTHQAMAKEYLESAVQSGSSAISPSDHESQFDPNWSIFDREGLIVQENADGDWGAVMIAPKDDKSEPVLFRNWLTAKGEFEKQNIALPFVPRPFPPRPLKQIVIHETVSFKGMVNPVVHFVVNYDGTIFQLADLQQRSNHAHRTEVHEQSVGIEFVNVPFDHDTDPNVTIDGKTILETGSPRTRVGINWAWDGSRSGFLVVPSTSQLEKLVVLVRTIIAHSTQGYVNKFNRPSGGIPPTVLNVVDAQVGSPPSPPKQYFVVSAGPDGVATTLGSTERRVLSPGILSHSAVGQHHFDGAFPTLYLWLRLEKRLAPRDALKAAIVLSARPLRKVNPTDSDSTVHAAAKMIDVTDVAGALTAPFPPPGTELREA